MAEWPQLGFGGGTNPFQIVVGSERDLPLAKLIRGCRSARVASAFVTTRGLSLLEPALRQCAESVRFIVGLDLPTEPKALRGLLDARAWKRKPEVRVFTKAGEAFHPKVYLFRKADGSEVGLVGSANLSGGGLQGNVECCALVHGAKDLALLGTWFERLWESWKVGRLTESALSILDSHQSEAVEVQRKESSLKGRLAEELENELELEELARRVGDLAEKTPLDRDRLGPLKVLKRLREALDFDNQFRKAPDGWKAFLLEPCFGYVPALLSASALSHKASLRRALRHLSRHEIPLSQRVDDVVARGELHVEGLGLGVVSKALIAFDRRRYAVYNGPVDWAFRRLGGHFLRGVSPGEKYSDFCEKLRRVTKEINLTDMVDVDILLYEYWREHAKNTRDDAHSTR